MKNYAVYYYEGKALVCWVVKAKTKEEAEKEFLYALACGEVYNFNDKEGIVSINECY